MKKMRRDIQLQFWVDRHERAQIALNQERAGIRNLSEFLRVLALSPSEISTSVHVPKIMRVREAHLGSAVEEGERKRATG